MKGTYDNWHLQKPLHSILYASIGTLSGRTTRRPLNRLSDRARPGTRLFNLFVLVSRISDGCSMWFNPRISDTHHRGSALSCTTWIHPISVACPKLSLSRCSAIYGPRQKGKGRSAGLEVNDKRGIACSPRGINTLFNLVMCCTMTVS